MAWRKAIFANIESPIALHFLARYPTPAAAAHLGEKRIAAFCRQHGYTGRRPAAELLSRLRSAPSGITDPTISQALRDSVLAQVSVLRSLNGGVKMLDTSIRARLEQHPDGKIFTSLPRSGVVNAAQMLAGWGDCRDAYGSPDAVAALAGLSPVTKESGKHRAVSFRWACNKRFRQAMTIYADNSRHASPWAANIYANARAAGKRPPACHPRPRARLDPGHLPVLARRHPLQAGTTRRRTTSRNDRVRRLRLTQRCYGIS